MNNTAKKLSGDIKLIIITIMVVAVLALVWYSNTVKTEADNKKHDCDLWAQGIQAQLAEYKNSLSGSFNSLLAGDDYIPPNILSDMAAWTAECNPNS